MFTAMRALRAFEPGDKQVSSEEREQELCLTLVSMLWICWQGALTPRRRRTTLPPSSFFVRRDSTTVPRLASAAAGVAAVTLARSTLSWSCRASI
ncbi:hypothetical protein Hypma_005204 [Hypsizygus marmoreus]|uniref:Uncharacterized protein n=1 Tax=Hypsizygus marmoreus TaxID=39966 RepID=A0A369K275_HYPMA|nr:hypothetical protein Hypma_005204 [Hypsizygus marmoreus]